MINTTTSPNTAVTLYFQAVSGLNTLPNLVVLREGSLATGDSYTFTETGSTGIYTIKYTPSATGKHMFYYLTTPFAYVDVVTRTIYTMIKNIEDESLGSWVWDKTAGTLAMLRQDGTSLADFHVVETLVEASRERDA